MNKLKIILSIFFICQVGFSQGINDSLNELNASFKVSEYNKVISLSKAILNSPDTLSSKQETEVLRMQGTAYFSIDELLSAEKSFISLLGIRSDFILDPSANSPKIISFFNNIKLKYLSSQISQTVMHKTDTLAVVKLKHSLQNFKDSEL